MVASLFTIYPTISYRAEALGCACAISPALSGMQ